MALAISYLVVGLMGYSIGLIIGYCMGIHDCLKYPHFFKRTGVNH
jgi:hypothetical protein